MPMNSRFVDKIDLGPHPYRNIAVFIIGTIISALGTVLATNSILGVTPSASLPYVVNLSTGLSLGIATFIMQMVFFVLGFIVMGRKNYKLIFLLTIPTLILYSLMCDLFMSMHAIPLQDYGGEWAVIIIATIVHALGISLQLASNLSMVPLDMFANHVAVRFKRDYGMVKVATDLTVVVLAVLLSYACFNELDGVGWGTLFAAITVGLIVSGLTWIYKRFGFYELIGHIEYDFRKDENL